MKAKKLIALLLCLAMVVGILPMSLAAEDTVAVASDSGIIKFKSQKIKEGGHSKCFTKTSWSGNEHDI